MPSVLEVRGLTAGYEKNVVVNGVSIDVAPGGGQGVLGRNGMGKTTIVRTITGILPCQSGTIVVDGHELQGQAAHRIARHGLAVVPQGRHVFKSLSVQENLDVVARGTAASRAKARRDVYELFPELAAIASRNASLLSGGQQQMLAFARAMMLGPRVMILDEPTEGLAPVVVERIRKAVAALRELGVGILVTEQNLRFLVGLVDEVDVLVKGEQVLRSDPGHLAENPHVLDRYLVARREPADEDDQHQQGEAESDSWAR
jgi:branched-chain amino acid transport system ATP-binding protein